MTEQLQLVQALTEAQYRIARALDSPELSEIEKDILKVIFLHSGAVNAIKSARVAELAGLDPGEGSRRFIAKTVEILVTLYKIPIGGLRVPPYGYFLIETRRDLDLAIAARWGEVYAHMRYLRGLTSREDVARLFGQGLLNLDAEQEGAWEVVAQPTAPDPEAA